MFSVLPMGPPPPLCPVHSPTWSRLALTFPYYNTTLARSNQAPPKLPVCPSAPHPNLDSRQPHPITPHRFKKPLYVFQHNLSPPSYYLPSYPYYCLTLTILSLCSPQLLRRVGI